MNRITNFIINFLLGFDFKNNFKIHKHNGIEIRDYPENNWNLIPYPKQKGKIYNSDNLTTTNRHLIFNESSFLNAKVSAESRWKINKDDHVRNISWRLHVYLFCVGLALKRSNKEKIFLECGTGKGYMAAGACEKFKWGSSHPEFYLIDSFSAFMPNSEGFQNSDGKKAFCYTDDFDEVKNYFSKYKNINIVKGILPKAIDKLPNNNKISFLHLDLNSANAEEETLIRLKPFINKETIILFDDYGGFGGEDQARVHEKYAKSNGNELLVLPTGQALIIN
jgi:hypothetical protein